MTIETYDGWALLLTVAAAGYLATLWQNRGYRRALRGIASGCRRCAGSGAIWMDPDHCEPCPNCSIARCALGLP